MATHYTYISGLNISEKKEIFRLNPHPHNQTKNPQDQMTRKG